MDDVNGWTAMLAENPGHSRWYIERFRRMADNEADLAGEARLVDALVPRGARILDAGAGTGRVGGHLAAAGHVVVGVDLDPELVEEARALHPGPQWLVGDIADLDSALADRAGAAEPFDAIVCAGNVMTFLARSERRPALEGFARHLAADGRAAIGFGPDRGYPVDDFLSDAGAAGLAPDLLLGTWDLRALRPSSDFLVAVLTHA
ncbi:class I SAM-dependent methyltransferase [Georgenia sp. Z1344]|uniref:class I SAM-dependent methyltransferase n=1 Tax=Georgenia sp. Z1344 TaxID=3416706 RepID=UPI003CE7B79C